MTAQINDYVDYLSHDWILAGERGSGLFEPASYGLSLASASSACWHGYAVRYAVADDALYLTRVDVALSGDAPTLFGCSPSRPSARGFSASYEPRRFKVPFLGTILLGRTLLRELHVNMGFPPPWKFGIVHELEFRDGVLTGAADKSAEFAELRAKLRSKARGPGPNATDAEREAWAAAAFTRKY